MASIIKSVWKLWESVEEMALDLGDSANLLRRERDAGRLPPERHDKSIAIRARALGRRKITHKAMAELRSCRPDILLDERRDLIGRFYDTAGGQKAVSERTGVSLTHLRANKSKGFLNRTARYEYRMLADEVGFDLPDAVFTPPKG